MLNLKTLALAAALALPATTMAFAGAAENALLSRYAGEWRGAGKVTGPDPGTVVCRITFKDNAAGKLTYTGRCSYSGQGAASFRGTVAYDEKTRKFVAASSAQGASNTTIGRRNGSTLTFVSGATDTRYGTVSSTMTLSPNAIKMAFKLVDDGQTTASSITLERR